MEKTVKRLNYRKANDEYCRLPPPNDSPKSGEMPFGAGMGREVVILL